MAERKKGEMISVVSKILAANDRVAEENRDRFRAADVAVIDIIGSPGAGKTALLEATLPRLAKEMAVGVIVGDISTTRDAERIAATGVPVVQITTDAFGGACHLEASTIRQALDHVSLEKLDLLFVENVGNLVCPAEFDLGQDRRAVVLSVTEGEDKPLKYPLAFREASVVVVSKIDLLPHLTYDIEALRANLKQVQPAVAWRELSARTGAGMDAWLEWVRLLA
jgi:hydrogenase nickel incorporation protein HypB